jgi:hypothetical protein
MYSTDYFIDKFSAIPDDRWCVGPYADGEGRFCARGHCGATKLGVYNDEDRALVKLFWFSKDAEGKSLYLSVSEVSDGGDKRYKQATPRERILTALDHIKKYNSEE